MLTIFRCVLKVSTANHRLLLMGDAQRRAEHHLVQHQPKALESEVILVGHHGSKTSSSPAFLEAVNADTALISAGYLNRYHFPAKVVTQRFEQRTMRAFNTADTGAITVTFPADETDIHYEHYRIDHRYFWHRR